MTPIYLGPSNCAAVVGEPWPRVRDRAARLGVRRVQAGKSRLVPVADYLAALAREADTATVEPVDPAEQVLAALRARRAGA